MVDLFGEIRDFRDEGRKQVIRLHDELKKTQDELEEVRNLVISGMRVGSK